MDITKILESIEKFKNWGIVRFFSRFFSESVLSPYVNAVKAMVSSDNAVARAKSLLVWGLVVAVMVFVIDQVIYYTKPGVLDRIKYEAARSVHGALTIADKAALLIKRGVQRISANGR